MIDFVRDFYCDDGDADREGVLRDLVARGTVEAVAFPTTGAPDVVQLFFVDAKARRRVFACVLITETRLHDDVTREPFVVEGFSLQVMQGRHLTIDAVRASSAAWIERCFPDLPVPAITVAFWSGDLGIEPSVIVEPALVPPPRPVVPGCRYFNADDGDVDYTIVATDLEHAKSILRASGIQFYDEDTGKGVPYDDARLTWIEYSAERAAKITCYEDDGSIGPWPLNTFALGEWFCSEI